jgi:hypothetical protein
MPFGRRPVGRPCGCVGGGGEEEEEEKEDEKVGEILEGGWVSKWVGLWVLNYATSYAYMSIKNCPRHNSVSHVYTKLTETNGRTNGASF